ncbi:hypothetical protein J6590_089277 [Homalodisca vitripennis]|nr:hypothetical protein J6590_097719 [Homalodisca vitripennis]KAG8309315.1 hypothetical protein J6590_089277 [Homalodisca vitripennis]
MHQNESSVNIEWIDDVTDTYNVRKRNRLYGNIKRCLRVYRNYTTRGRYFLSELAEVGELGLH